MSAIGNGHDVSCRFCAPRWSLQSSTSACRRSARAFCPRTDRGRWSRSIRCTSSRARVAGSFSSLRSSRRKRSSRTTRTSRRTRPRGWSTRAYVEMIRGASTRPDDLVVELASTTDICSSTSSAPGSRSSASIRPRTSRRRRRSAEFRRSLSSSAARRPTARLGGTAGEPHRRQQRPRAGSRPNDFVGGVQLLLRDRHRDVRVPAPAASARRASVRHDLPRALLVLLVRDDRRRSSAPRARRVRRRGVVDAWRIAARLRATRRWPASVRTASRCSARESRGLRWPERYDASPRREGVEARPSRPPDRFGATEGRSSGTERRAKATRCSTTAGSVRISSTTPSTGIRTSTGSTRLVRTSRSIRPSASRRRGRTTWSCFPGTSSTRSPRTLVCRGVGREADRSGSVATVASSRAGDARDECGCELDLSGSA